MTRPQVPKSERLRPIEQITNAGLLGAEFVVNAAIGAVVGTVVGATQGVRRVHDQRQQRNGELSEVENYANDPNSFEQQSE